MAKPPKPRIKEGFGKYFSGNRTDTQVVRKRYTDDGSIYYERKDGSLYPKVTTIAICRSIKSLIYILKDYNNYPNVDELLFEMLMARTEARSFPKYRIDRAVRDIKLRRSARVRAIHKVRFFPTKDAWVRKDVEEMREKEGGYAKKKSPSRFR